MRNKYLGLVVLLLTLTGCSSIIHHGGERHIDRENVKLFLPPFFNATDDDHAGRALTELTASALLEREIPLVQTEPALYKSRVENAAGLDGLYQDARSVQATHLLIGTVHEYRYKTDLDGDPAVAITLRLVDAKTGNTLWQGSSTKVSVIFASVSSAAQRAVRDLVKRVPLHEHHEHHYLHTKSSP